METIVRIAWTLLIALVAALCIFPIQSGDLLLYLSIARRFFAQGTLPATDPFIYSLQDHAWPVYPEWLTYVVWYGAYLIGGWTLIILLKAALFALLPALLAIFSKHVGAGFWALVLGLVATGASAYHFIERGAVFTTLLSCGVVAILLLEARAPGRAKFALPAIFLAWVNLHPGFAVGLVAVGCALAARFKDWRSREWRLLAGCLGASVVACCLNPKGLRGLAYPFVFHSRELEVYKHYVFEWFSPYHPAYQSSAETLLFTLMLIATAGLAALAWVMGERWKRKPVLEILLAGLFGYLGTSAIRFLPMATFVLAIIGTSLVAIASGDAAHRAPDRRVSWGAAAILGAILIKITVWGYHPPAGDRRLGFGLDPVYFPAASVSYIENLPVTGNLYNGQDFGAYLAWRWDGSRKYFYDGFVQDPGFLVTEYLGIEASPADFDRVTSKYGITVLLLDRYAGIEKILRILALKPEWKHEFTDPASLVFVKR